MRTALAALLLAAAALAPGTCAPTPAAERAFAPGRWTYESTWRAPGASAPTRHAGALVLEAVRPESLVGRWEVPGYLPTFPYNDFSVVSYYVAALAVEGGDTLVVSHYLRRDPRTGAVGCRVGVATRAGGYREEGSCTVTGPR